jgi:hypothetical protein
MVGITLQLEERDSPFRGQIGKSIRGAGLGQGEWPFADPAMGLPLFARPMAF